MKAIRESCKDHQSHFRDIPKIVSQSEANPLQIVTGWPITKAQVMIFEELKSRAIPYSVVRFTIQSLDDTKVVYQILVDYAETLAAEFMRLGFHRERLTRFRNRYMWRPLTGRELARFLEARYPPVYQDGENMIWNFLGGVKRRFRKKDI